MICTFILLFALVICYQYGRVTEKLIIAILVKNLVYNIAYKNYFASLN